MSSISDKGESIQKVGETMGSKPTDLQEDLERTAPNKEHFQNLMNSSDPLKGSIQKWGEAAVVPPPDSAKENQLVAEEGSSSQKMGSATDQENQKRGKRDQGEDEEVSAVGSSRGKKSSLESSALSRNIEELGSQVSDISKLSPESVKAQANQVIAQMENAKKQLSQPNVEIKASYQTLLRNRLGHIDDTLKIALSKAGVEYVPPPANTKNAKGNVVLQFIEMLTSSQDQIGTLNKTFDDFKDEKGNISQANLMKIQVKMSYVSHQVELFANMLNKCLEGIKTVMNIQV
ncbi:MAG: hypothetical protein Q8K60_03650 [Parachlamydiaceae bacterium]|nr:hypothetical protein [Parachlamydiaceae bacterium]